MAPDTNDGNVQASIDKAQGNAKKTGNSFVNNMPGPLAGNSDINYESIGSGTAKIRSFLNNPTINYNEK